MKTIQQLEDLFDAMRIQYVRRYAKEQGWDITKLHPQDLIGIYVCLEIKEQLKDNFKKRIDK